MSTNQVEVSDQYTTPLQQYDHKLENTNQPSQDEKKLVQEQPITRLVPLIHEFFNNCSTHAIGMEFLKANKCCNFFEYNRVSSRKILMSLIVYKFGKDLGYPETLFTNARKMILFFLRNGETEEDERKKVVEEYLQTFNEFKKQDLQKYMHDLAIEYAQLQDIKDRLLQSDKDLWTIKKSDKKSDDEDSEESDQERDQEFTIEIDDTEPTEDDDTELTEDIEIWLEQIDYLQKKILRFVHFSNGYDDFHSCLGSLLIIKKQAVEDLMEKAYWDTFLKDLDNKDYRLLLSNFQEIKCMLLEMHEDEDTKEIMDESYLKQLIERDLFDDRAMIGQIEFVFSKMKKYGVPVYDKLLEKSKTCLIEDIEQNGLSPEVVVKTFQKIFTLLKLYLDIIQIYRKQLQNKS
jgi:hypothetical protein